MPRVYLSPKTSSKIRTYSDASAIPLDTLGYVGTTLYHNPNGTAVAVDSAGGAASDSYDWAASILGGRTWDSYVTASPGDDLVAKMAAITTASSSNRVCLYVKNGTYTVTSTLTSKNWVDIVGESEDGVLITTAGDYDTGKIESHSLWANMTLESTGAYYRYPLHIDWGPPSALVNPSSTMVLVNVTCTSTGDKKAGCGIGLYALQRLILVNCTFESTYRSGLYAHNQASQASPCELYVINCTATSTAASLDGFEWVNQGSTKEDQIRIIGGSFTGGAGGYAIREWNSGAGASEARISISPSTTAATTSTTSANTLVSFPDILPTISTPDRFRSWAGAWQAAPSTIAFGADGIAYPYSGVWKFVASTGNTKMVKFWASTSAGNTYWGQNGNSDAIFPGGTNYAATFGTATNHNVEFVANNAVRQTLTGTACTFSVPVTSTQFKLSALNTAPTSASDTGTLGEVRIDADYIYVCTASNTWKRAAIATWS